MNEFTNMPVPPKAKQGEWEQSREQWGEAFGVKICMRGCVTPWILFFCLMNQVYECSRNSFCWRVTYLWCLLRTCPFLRKPVDTLYIFLHFLPYIFPAVYLSDCSILLLEFWTFTDLEQNGAITDLLSSWRLPARIFSWLLIPVGKFQMCLISPDTY